jgi:ABC-type dipeptide/oligopeptide/nickel transport system permease component
MITGILIFTLIFFSALIVICLGAMSELNINKRKDFVIAVFAIFVWSSSISFVIHRTMNITYENGRSDGIRAVIEGQL